MLAPAPSSIPGRNDSRRGMTTMDFRKITWIRGALGYTVGHWEGDTLVLDAISFVDTTWLGRGGFFHSEQMHVVEKFTRQGDVILYDVTVEDPEVLVEPWCCPHERCGATQIPTRAFSENGATARCTNSTTSPHRSATNRCDCDFAICFGMTRWRLS